MQYRFYLASSLEKVFPGRCPKAMENGSRLSAWQGTRAAVQLVYYVDGVASGEKVPDFALKVEGAPMPVSMRRVELIPSDFPCFESYDEYYITTEPGLFPDLLEPMTEAVIKPLPRQYRSVWLSWDIPEDVTPGEYEITVTATADTQTYKNHFILCIGKAVLPKQKLLHTEWFHTDCLAEYYKVDVFSEEYWTIVENFMQAAAKDHGINMLLTPVFTPSLDTAVGGERLTVQLVDVYCNNGAYTFGFEKLTRWVEMCKKHGIEYLEIAHLFTQWGAHATPKIIGVVDGVKKRIFGWDVSATSAEYRVFLEAFLPALRIFLENLGYDRDHVYYHISDEPYMKDFESFRAARAQVEDLLERCQVIDALSDFEFYQHGLVKQPIPDNAHIQPFIDAKVPNLWVYYCCGQNHLVPNRYFAMESARNRIMGVLMYLYNMKGFLHWGYNFYKTEWSIRSINPYYITHGGYAFPSGDAFLVYPGPDGMPLSSIRAEVQQEAFVDMRALQLLESLAGREAVERIIYKETDMYPLTYKEYPRDAAYLLSLREHVAAEIEKY